jgi:hypothetical protein
MTSGISAFLFAFPIRQRFAAGIQLAVPRHRIHHLGLKYCLVNASRPFGSRFSTDILINCDHKIDRGQAGVFC